MARNEMTEIENLKARIKEADQWIPEIYREKVRRLRTRSFAMAIAERLNDPLILHTLLGVELKVGKLRIACPELSTARYLRVFARIGCREVAIPYDITAVPGLADELETAWQRTLLTIEDASARARNALIKRMREEIEACGAGEMMPEFNTPTRRRKPAQ